MVTIRESIRFDLPLTSVQAELDRLIVKNGCPSRCSITFSVMMSRWQRGRFRRELKHLCWTHQCEVTIEEDAGWFESVARIRVALPQERVNAAVADLYAWLKALDL